MSDPLEFLRQRAQAEQTQAAITQAAAATKSVSDAFRAVGFEPEMVDRLTLEWFRYAVRQVNRQ